MTSLAQRRVAGGTALIILMYLLQGALLTAPSQADTHSPDDPGYWLERYPDAVSCHKWLGDADHGTLVDGGKAVELAVHADHWLGDHWEVLVVNGGAEDGGDGHGNAVYEHPDPGVAYYPPVDTEGVQPLVSHWIVCKGFDYDVEGGPTFDIGACDERGLTSVTFTVEAETEVTIGGVPASDSEPAFQPGDHELHLSPGTYTWILFSPLDSGIERETGSFTVDECDTTSTTEGSTSTTLATTSTTQATTPTTLGSTTTTQDTTPTTLASATTQVTTPPTTVPETVPSTSTPFDSVPEDEEEEGAEILGTTITTAPPAERAPDEVSADTLPFTGSESRDVASLALLALMAGSLLLLAARTPRDDENSGGVGGW